MERYFSICINILVLRGFLLCFTWVFSMLRSSLVCLILKFSMYWCFLYYCLYTLIAWAHEHSDHARVLTGKTTTAAMSRFASTMLMISAPFLSESGVDNMMSPGYLIREVFEGTSHQQNEDENNNAMTTPVPAILRRTCRRAVNITPPFMHLSPSDDLGSVERSRVSIVEPCRRVYNSDDAPSVFPFVHVHARAEVCRLRTCVRILVFAMPYTLTLSRWIFFRYCRVPCDTAKRLYLRISLFLETDIVWYHSMHLNPRIYSEEYRENTYTWSVLRIQYSSCFIRRPSSVVVRHPSCIYSFKIFFYNTEMSPPNAIACWYLSR